MPDKCSSNPCLFSPEITKSDFLTLSKCFAYPCILASLTSVNSENLDHPSSSFLERFGSLLKQSVKSCFDELEQVERTSISALDSVDISQKRFH